jgi:sulfur dioxygenase
MELEHTPTRRFWVPPRRSTHGAWQVDPSFVHTCRARRIDVREAPDLADGAPTLDRGEHVPFSELLSKAAGWDRHDPVVLISETGTRSDAAALELERLGFTRVASMAGGLRRWYAEGLG